MEQQIANSIWEMLAAGFNEGEISEGFETVDIYTLIEEVAEEYRAETEEPTQTMPYE